MIPSAGSPQASVGRKLIRLASGFSASSDWVKGEAAEGLRRKILVPVRIDSANVPLEFRRLQTVDLSDWKGCAGHPELGGFLEAAAATYVDIVTAAGTGMR